MNWDYIDTSCIEAGRYIIIEAAHKGNLPAGHAALIGSVGDYYDHTNETHYIYFAAILGSDAGQIVHRIIGKITRIDYFRAEG